MKAASVHRFHDYIALSLPGTGETCYIPADAARKLARALNRYARSVEKEKFFESALGTATIPLSNNGSRFGR